MGYLELFVIFMVGVLLLSIPSMLFQKPLFRCQLREKWGLTFESTSRFDTWIDHVLCGSHGKLIAFAAVAIPVAICIMGLIVWPSILDTPASRYVPTIIVSVVILNVSIPVIRFGLSQWLDPVEKTLAYIKKQEQEPLDKSYQSEKQNLLSQADIAGEVFRIAYRRFEEESGQVNS